MTSTVTVLLTAVLWILVRFTARYSPSSCVPLGRVFGLSWNGGVLVVRPLMPKSLSLLMTRYVRR